LGWSSEKLVCLTNPCLVLSSHTDIIDFVPVIIDNDGKDGRITVVCYVRVLKIIIDYTIRLHYSLYYRVGQKMAQFFVYLITSPNINRFSKFFHCQNQETICN